MSSTSILLSSLSLSPLLLSSRDAAANDCPRRRLCSFRRTKKSAAASVRGSYLSPRASSSSSSSSFSEKEEESGKLHLDGGRSTSKDPDMSDEASISWPYSRVEEFMTKDPETLREDLKLTDPKVQNFIKRYHGGPVVNSRGDLVGVISRNDIKRLSYISFGEEQRHIRTIADAMTSMPLTVGPKAYISAAAGLMLKHKIHRLPVVEEGEDYAHPGKLIGIITRSDIWEPLIQNSLLLDEEFQKRRCVKPTRSGLRFTRYQIRSYFLSGV
jgi:CBS domain-containing protein